MTIQELLYRNWLKKLEALKAENEKHDFSDAGEAAYDLAFREAKQAYHLLGDIEMELYDAGNKAVYK